MNWFVETMTSRRRKPDLQVLLGGGRSRERASVQDPGHRLVMHQEAPSWRDTLAQLLRRAFNAL